MFSSSLEALSVKRWVRQRLCLQSCTIWWGDSVTKEDDQWCDRRGKREQEEGHLTRSPMPSFTFSSGCVALLFFPERCPKPNGSSKQSYAFIYHIFSSPVQESACHSFLFCVVLFCFVFACHSFNEIRLVLGDLLPFLIILLPLVIERSTCLRLQGVKMRGRVQKED